MKGKALLLALSLSLIFSSCGAKTNSTINSKTEKINNEVLTNNDDSLTSSNLEESNKDETAINKNNEISKEDDAVANSEENSTVSLEEKPTESSETSLNGKNTIETQNNTDNSNNTTNTSSNEEDVISVNSNTTGVSNKSRDWYYLIKKNGVPSDAPEDAKELLKKYNGYFLGDTSSKDIYLTFDEGYENGYSGKILDILKENNVPAAFFVTTPYIKGNTDLIKRMVKEGHVVGNHSTHHPSMPDTANQGFDKFKQEFDGCSKLFQEVTGTEMPKFFRPPMGKYSELSLDYTNKLGYKSIFWSFAYHDWDPKNQPSHESALNTIKERTHPGGIYLLHAVSKTNTEILDKQIKLWKEQGYNFKSLTDLP